MVAFALDQVSAIGADEPFPRLAVQPGSDAVSHDRTDEEILAAAVSRARNQLPSIKAQFEKTEQVQRQCQDDLRILELNQASDDWITERMASNVYFHSVMKEREDSLRQFVENLHEFRRRTGAWSAEADSLVSDLMRLCELAAWAQRAALSWSAQLCDEYAMRYPASQTLPFEPLDLGPTDSSNLPPVL